MIQFSDILYKANENTDHAIRYIILVLKTFIRHSIKTNVQKYVVIIIHSFITISTHNDKLSLEVS